jgi:hypothetical protein
LVPGAAAAAGTAWNTQANPIDPAQLSKLPFGARSHWLQPWRSSLETRPATALRDAVGINFNVSATEAPSTAKLLAASGFKRARVEIGWGSFTYADPSQLNIPSWYATIINSMKTNGIRPLLLLNANHGGPGPMKTLNLTLTAAVAANSKTVTLDSASAAQVVPGLTGINAGGMAAGVLITKVDSAGVATLSRPLPTALPAGPAASSTLRYEPFAKPFMSDGTTPNPRFERTMAGWLAYVKNVTQLVKTAYGSDNFDVEVWNELGFGSAFLYNSYYYNPTPEVGAGSAISEILKRTAAFIKDPANGVANVKVGDGFANQSPWVSGATEPVGVDAIDKHPYNSGAVYPSGSVFNGMRPTDALGNPNYTTFMDSTNHQQYKDVFIPNYRAILPEWGLTGLQTETLERELTALPQNVQGTAHGRATHPVGGPAPGMWITEYGLDLVGYSPTMTAAEMDRARAKNALRFLTSYASRGATAIDLFAVKGGSRWQHVAQPFFDQIKAAPGTYPTADPGPVMPAIGRMSQALNGAQTISTPRQLRLDAIADNHDNVQFKGNATAAFPDLHDRDVLAFYPFQVDAGTFVAPVYVMTRDVSKLYNTTAPAGTPGRYDMPPETFRLTIGNVNPTTAAVSMSDPLTGANVPVSIVARASDTITVELTATDSPRMLRITGS